MIDELIEREGLPADYRAIVQDYWEPLAGTIAGRSAGRRPFVVGINGAQGSGKSTAALFLQRILEERGHSTVILSLDDIYLPKAERAELARTVHPLFATRGVPGTHDTGLAMSVLDDLAAGRDTTLPRFDKAIDDRIQTGQPVNGPVDIVLFEGWCVGAGPQDEIALARPVNALEREEDPDTIWRKAVNHHLRTDYARLFYRIDMLVMLKVSGFEAVARNRTLQEEKLRARSPDAPGLMDEAALTRFLAHYERLTRHMLEEMPARADIVLDIGPDQAPQARHDRVRG